MKIKTITTANIKNPAYNANHIFVGTHTGSFKRIDVFADNTHAQENLQSISSLNKHSRITAMEWGDENDASNKEFTSTIELDDGPIIGAGRFDGKVIAGLAGGKVQIFQQRQEFLQAGDHLSRMRQCKENKKLIATGGKGRQNNLKVWDLETKTKVFTSKNLPNDYLELEVPVWDSDIVFIDAHQLATCSRYGYLRVYDTRKQRRPVLEYVNPKEQIAYGCATVHENTLFVGSASGIVRAFNTRKMKTIEHTYKGFTGSVTDIVTDHSGKYLFTSCLDRFVRVHSVESTALQYQCYVKSKATQILMRTYDDQPDCVMLEDSNSNEADDNQESADDSDDELESEQSGSDSEYEEMFQQMQTVDEEKQERLNKKRKTQESVKKNKISKKKK